MTPHSQPLLLRIPEPKRVRAGKDLRPRDGRVLAATGPRWGRRGAQGW